MKRVILGSSKSYEYLGYRVYDSGSGFVVYQGNKQLSGEFTTSEDAEEYIREIKPQLPKT